MLAANKTTINFIAIFSSLLRPRYMRHRCAANVAIKPAKTCAPNLENSPTHIQDTSPRASAHTNTHANGNLTVYIYIHTVAMSAREAKIRR